MERILLLSMGFGTGHNAVAKILQTEFQRHPGAEVKVVDLLTLIPKTFHPLLQNFYLGMLNRFPLFYHYLHDWTHQSKWIRTMSTGFIEKMGWTIRRKINQLLTEVEPTRIVTTHPFALLTIPSRWLDTPSIGVVTDYELHPIWFARVPDVLCIPKKLMNPRQLERMEWTTGASIVETGIPIDRSFYESISRRKACEQLQLSQDRPIVLVMGGGTGLGPLEELVKRLRLLTHYHFVILTGNNQYLYQTLSDEYAEPHIQIEAYRNDMNLWMSAADLLVTKPGGVTITEAVAKELPLFLFEAFPGQEEANQQHLLTQGVAWETDPLNIQKQIEQFFQNQAKREQCKNNVEQLVTPQAIDQIVQETFQAEVSNAQVLYL